MTEDEETEALLDVLADIFIEQYLKKKKSGSLTTPLPTSQPLHIHP